MYGEEFDSQDSIHDFVVSDSGSEGEDIVNDLRE